MDYSDRTECCVYCVKASALPLSIIIVGIGAADFEGMCISENICSVLEVYSVLIRMYLIDIFAN